MNKRYLAGSFLAITLGVVGLFSPHSTLAAYSASDLLGQLQGDLPYYTATAQVNAPNERGFSSPYGAAVDLVRHRLFQLDSVNSRVLIFNLTSANALIDRVADNVLGQADFKINTASTTQAGLSSPKGISYDPVNNRLFVSDTGNSRVMVFDVSTITNGMNASYVLGQTLFTTAATSTSQTGLFSPQQVGYDNANNRLFVADTSNNRVMLFNVATSSIASGEAASGVLGQTLFTSATSTASQGGMSGPTGVTYDATSTRLFVSDNTNNRVLVFTVTSTIANGQNATSLLGQTSFTSSTAITGQAGLSAPNGLAYDSAGNRLFVADTTYNRVMIFTTTSTIVNGQNATNVLGQTSFAVTTASTTQTGMSGAVGVAFDAQNNRLYTSETSNQRVLVFNISSVTDGQAASDLLGHLDRTDTPVYTATPANDGTTLRGTKNPISSAIDTVHHRFFVAHQQSGPGSSAVTVYNLDTNNNLIDHLADNVIGQVDFYGALFTRTQNNMRNPIGVAYDSVNNRLFVSDTSDARVLVFDTTVIADNMNASYVIGQPDFNTSVASTSQAGMSSPRRLAYDEINSRLFVPDASNNRITVYNVAPGTIANGIPAAYVIGQPTYGTSTAATTQSGLNVPSAVEYDATNQRLFAADPGNNRVLVFDVRLSNMANGMNASYVIGQTSFTSSTGVTAQNGISNPADIAYNAADNTLWISEFNNSRVSLFDVNPATMANGGTVIGILGQSSFVTSATAVTQTGLTNPQGLSIDPGNNRLYVSDSNNRIMIYNLATITSSCPATGDVGQAYNATFTAANNQGTISFALASGTLPTGLSFSGATLTGNPSASGDFTFAMRAVDNNGTIGSFYSQPQTCTMNVRGVPVGIGSNSGGSSGGGGGGSSGGSSSAPSTNGSGSTSSSGNATTSSNNSGVFLPAQILTFTVPTSTYKFNHNLRLGVTDNDVREFQKYLNTHGFVVAISGAGSPGNETAKFGALTFKALIKFQEAYKNEILIPAGVPSGKGTGFLGPFTRAVLNR